MIVNSVVTTAVETHIWLKVSEVKVRWIGVHYKITYSILHTPFFFETRKSCNSSKLDREKSVFTAF